MKHSERIILAGLVLILTVLLLSHDRTRFWELTGLYVCFFGAYVWICKRQTALGEKGVTFWLLVAILARMIALFFFPNLSDDIYRFIWDGTLTLQGFSPYDLKPSDALQAGILSDPELFGNLNSPEYYSVYPPVCQAIFAAVTWAGGSDWATISVLTKVIFVAAECGSIALLYRLCSSSTRPRILLYALNPLIIIELTGNLHFEAIMLFFMLLGYWLLKSSRFILAGVALALAIGTKLIPLLFIPFLLRRLHPAPLIKVYAAGFASLILVFLPLFTSDMFGNMSQSVGLYFQTFEFNASIYYVMRWLGYQYSGYNMIGSIGPALSYLTIAVLGILFLMERKPHLDNYPRVIVLSFSIYLFMSTTVHPWYLATLVGFCCLTPIRFPFVWSGLIIFSYAAYQTEVYSENLWLVSLEYLILLGYIVWEFRKNITRSGRSRRKLSGRFRFR